jgi:hypothetical protein
MRDGGRSVRAGSTALWLAVAFCVACGNPSTTPSAVEDHGAASLREILAADPRDSPASCANIDTVSRDVTGRSLQAPPNPDGPTLIDLFLFVIAIDQIDTTTNSFRFEGYGGLIWCDPRLAFDADEAGRDFKQYRGESSRRGLDDIWWPGVNISSQLGVADRSNEMLAVFADGTVYVGLTFNTRMIANYDFADFPLDRQTLTIPIQASRWNAAEVQVVSAARRVGFDSEFRIPEWDVLSHNSILEKTDGLTRFVMEIEIGRRYGYYLWKIVLPLFIISCIAWSTFWMTRDALAQRQRQSATSILSVVAYQFVAGSSLPRVPYLTLLDGLFLWTYICVGVTLITNVVAKRRFRESEESGLRTDRIGRILFPLVYVVGGGLTLLVQQLL